MNSMFEMSFFLAVLNEMGIKIISDVIIFKDNLTGIYFKTTKLSKNHPSRKRRPPSPIICWHPECFLNVPGAVRCKKRRRRTLIK